MGKKKVVDASNTPGETCGKSSISVDSGYDDLGPTQVGEAAPSTPGMKSWSRNEVRRFRSQRESADAGVSPQRADADQGVSSQGQEAEHGTTSEKEEEVVIK